MGDTATGAGSLADQIPAQGSPDPNYDYDTHPILGPVGFPKEMSAQDRNQWVNEQLQARADQRHMRGSALTHPGATVGTGSGEPDASDMEDAHDWRSLYGAAPAALKLGTGIVKSLGSVMDAYENPGSAPQAAEDLIAPQAEQFRKAGETEGMESAGHALAGAIPFVGPMAANAGEDLGRGNLGGGMVNALAAAGGARGEGEPLGELEQSARYAAGDFLPRNKANEVQVSRIPGRVLGQVFPESPDKVAARNAALEAATQAKVPGRGRVFRAEAPIRGGVAPRAVADIAGDLARRQAQEAELEKVANARAQDGGATPRPAVPLYPEPRGQGSNLFGSIPREELPGAARRGIPGAAEQERLLGKQFLFKPKEAFRDDLP